MGRARSAKLILVVFWVFFIAHQSISGPERKIHPPASPRCPLHPHPSLPSVPARPRARLLSLNETAPGDPPLCGQRPPFHQDRPFCTGTGRSAPGPPPGAAGEPAVPGTGGCWYQPRTQHRICGLSVTLQPQPAPHLHKAGFSYAFLSQRRRAARTHAVTERPRSFISTRKHQFAMQRERRRLNKPKPGSALPARRWRFPADVAGSVGEPPQPGARVGPQPRPRSPPAPRLPCISPRLGSEPRQGCAAGPEVSDIRTSRSA